MAKIIGNKNPKKETTMDDLAVAIGNLSERMDKRFSEVNDRFTKQEIKLEKMMDEKVEDLAVMVNKSFVSVTTKIDAIKLDTTATKDDLNSLRQDMNNKFDQVNNSIEGMSLKMDKMADVVYLDHRIRIVNLENRTQKLETSR